MTLKTCRYWLAGIWLSGAAVLLFLMIARTAEGNAPTSTTIMWRWLLPNLIPFVTLVVTAVVVVHADASASRANSAPVDRFVFFATAAISVFYLLSLSVMLITPVMNPGHDIAEALGGSGTWMTPLQGVVGAALGVFFVKPRRH